MSRLWHDNPDYYDTATLDRFWSVVSADAIVSAGDGYDGAGALSATTDDAYVIDHGFIVGDPLNRFRVGCRLWLDALPATEQIILGVVDDDAIVQCCLSLNTDGTLNVRRGDVATGTVLATSTATVSTGAHHRIGFKGTVSHTGGELEAHLDSVTGTLNRVAAVTGEDTAFTDLISWKGIYVGLFTDMFASHFYANDGEGTVNDLIHGFRTRFEFLDAAVLDEWDKSTGTMIAALDDAAPDDDTTYLFTDIFHARYTGTVTFPLMQRVFGVQTTALVENEADSGFSPSHQPMVVVNDVEYIAAFQSVIVGTWRAIRKMWPVNPGTGVPWTPVEIDEASYGGRVET